MSDAPDPQPADDPKRGEPADEGQERTGWGWGARLFVAFGAGFLAIAVVFVAENLMEARKNGNETSAIGALKMIGTAQSLFRESDKEKDGNLDYGTLRELGEAGLIDPVLGSGTKNGYLFAATYGCFTSEFIWYAVARPITPGRSGDRYFVKNHEGVAFYTSAQAFSLNSVDCTQPARVQAICR